MAVATMRCPSSWQPHKCAFLAHRGGCVWGGLGKGHLTTTFRLLHDLVAHTLRYLDAHFGVDGTRTDLVGYFCFYSVLVTTSVRVCQPKRRMAWPFGPLWGATNPPWELYQGCVARLCAVHGSSQHGVRGLGTRRCGFDSTEGGGGGKDRVGRRGRVGRRAPGAVGRPHPRNGGGDGHHHGPTRGAGPVPRR